MIFDVYSHIFTLRLGVACGTETIVIEDEFASVGAPPSAPGTGGSAPPSVDTGGSQPPGWPTNSFTP